MLYCSDKSGICQNMEQSRDPVTTFVFPLYGVISGELKKGRVLPCANTLQSRGSHRGKVGVLCRYRWRTLLSYSTANCSKSSLHVLMYQHAWPEIYICPMGHCGRCYAAL